MRVPKQTQAEVVATNMGHARKHKLTSAQLRANLTEAGCSIEETEKLVKEFEDNPNIRDLPTKEGG